MIGDFTLTMTASGVKCSWIFTFLMYCDWSLGFEDQISMGKSLLLKDLVTGGKEESESSEPDGSSEVLVSS